MDGVWRTINGTKVFIKDGQTVDEALSERGFATGPNGTPILKDGLNAKNVIKEVIKAKDNTECRYYGLRVDARELGEGEYFGNSKDENDEELAGTSAVCINIQWSTAEDIDEDEIADVKKMIDRLNEEYVGMTGRKEYIYLVGGEDSEYGNDPNELVIKRGKVIVRLK